MKRACIAVAVIVGAASGCVHIDGHLALTVQGQVVDDADGTPLSNVIVDLVDVGIRSHWPGPPWETALTDDDGKAYIHLDERYGYTKLCLGAPEFGKDRCAVRLSKEGYKTKRMRFKGSELTGSAADLGVVKLERTRRGNRKRDAEE